MTTAHRPTFDAAKGRATTNPSSIYHARSLPAHMQMKYRKRGQGGVAGLETVASEAELKPELLAESGVSDVAQYRKEIISQHREMDADSSSDESEGESDSEAGEELQKGVTVNVGVNDDTNGNTESTNLQNAESGSESRSESGSESEESEDSESDSEDETTLLLKELEKIKQERREQKEQAEREERAKQLKKEEEELLNANAFKIRKGWEEDTLFHNQAKGVNKKKDPRDTFVNDLLRSDFHRKFMDKYIR